MSGPSGLILVLGGGQVARALEQAAAALAAVPVRRLVRPELDMADTGSLVRALDLHGPAVVVNAAAWTAVDQAEQEPQAAMAVNAHAVGNLARLCRDRGIVLVHYSTDYVFDGTLDRPYREDDPASPVSAYGRSKADGGRLLAASGADWLCLRTAWVFGEGNNFIRSILRAARERPALRVVGDQVGSPTYARDLAEATFRLLDAGARGLVNAANTGYATRDELARHALACAGLSTPVEACTTAEYPLPAPRPLNSRLDLARLEALTGWRPPHWREAVRDYVETEASST